MTGTNTSILPMLFVLGSIAFLLLFWIGAILWCAVRYDKAPVRYGAMAGLFATMLIVQLVWPIVRLSIRHVVTDFGIPLELAAAGFGGMDSLLALGIPAVALAVIGLQSDAPSPS